jgi:hypothetical protein
MFALTVIMPLLVASAGECYLVTSDGISEIPCDFSAAATDALRYAAEETAEAKARRARQQQRDAAAPARGRFGTFQRGPNRGGFRR